MAIAETGSSGRAGFEEKAMSVILRILFIVAGFITALFVARDSLNFDLVQTWMAILLVIILVGAGSLWALRRKT